MFEIIAVSNDGQIQINTTSKIIRVVSPNISDNTNYYHNFQLKFNGTFVPSQQLIYISTIYNYFLINYGVELIGDIDCVAGSIMFAAGVDQSNATVQQLLINGTIKDANSVLPGYPLIMISLGNYQLNISSEAIVSPPTTKVSTTRTSSTKPTTKRSTTTPTMAPTPVSYKWFSKVYLNKTCIFINSQIQKVQ